MPCPSEAVGWIPWILWSGVLNGQVCSSSVPWTGKLRLYSAISKGYDAASLGLCDADECFSLNPMFKDAFTGDLCMNSCQILCVRGGAKSETTCLAILVMSLISYLQLPNALIHVPH